MIETPPSGAEASVHNEVVRGMLSRAGLVAAPASSTLVAAPPAPSAANQVNLHQYFGPTRVAGAAPAETHHRKWLSLFHHKSRPTIQQVEVSGLAGAPASEAPASPAVVPGQIPSAVPGAGSGPVDPGAR